MKSKRTRVGRPARIDATAEIRGSDGIPPLLGDVDLVPSPIADTEDQSTPLCVVGIGGAEGGVEALSTLLSRLPVGTGMAFVVVLHRGDDPAAIAQLLARDTAMPVSEAAHRTVLEADHVYLVPTDTSPTYADGRILLAAGEERPSGPGMPIDGFLRSLALERKSRAAGVILSGIGSDGALGIQTIKEAGGLALTQDARSARFDGMPLAALATGCVDVMLPPAELAVELGSIADRLRVAAKTRRPSPTLDDEEDLRRIFTLLRAARDVDFTLYRHTTIRRRILRRMILSKVPTLREYLDVLRDRPLEVEALYQDILIKVTHFFRDPEVFEVLKRKVFPALLHQRAGDSPIRVWVPGCSTGEEVYSLAIALLEHLADEHRRVPLQIFGTDLSEAALETARSGTYIENIAGDVSPERLRRFFTRRGKQHQIDKAIRASCVFARQNLTRDPPFSRLDLVSCRNLLIYLEPALQRRVIPLLHYALKPSGYLVLGASETVGPEAGRFSIVDKKNKIYTKKAAAARTGPDLSAGEIASRSPRAAPPGAHAAKRSGLSEAQEEADRLLMERYAPAGVLVDADLAIVQFRGSTGPFLEPAPGEASLNLLKMARKGLGLELRAAVHKARRTEASVQVERIELRDEGAAAKTPPRIVSVEVVPLQARGEPSPAGPDERWFLILFHDHGAEDGEGSRRRAGRAGAADDTRVARLERELAAAKEYLQVTLEEQEATHEELQSANEELLSSNEELQSINEELETAKEEQEASNEELATLNAELQRRNTELLRLTSDLHNLLGSVDLPILMLGLDRTIRSFTPSAGRVLHLIPADIGRPIGDLNPRLEAPDLEDLITEVIDTMIVREREVRDRDGRWYSLRIRPYRTADNKIDGAVVMLIDIDRARRGSGNAGDAPPLAAAEVAPASEG